MKVLGIKKAANNAIKKHEISHHNKPNQNAINIDRNLESTPIYISNLTNNILENTPENKTNYNDYGFNDIIEEEGSIDQGGNKFTDTNDMDINTTNTNNPIKIYGGQNINDVLSAYKALNIELKLKKPATACQSLLSYYKNDYHLFYKHINCLSLLISLGLILWLYCIHFKDPIVVADLDSTLSSITYNLNSIPWNDLDVIPMDQNCSDNFSELMIGLWPGTIAACNANNEAVSCLKTQSIPAKGLYHWKHQKFCVKYSQNYKVSIQCPDDTIQCYQGGCFNKQEGCPITNLSLYPSDQADWQKIVDFANTKLFIQKIKGNQPVSNVTYEVNANPCLNINMSPFPDYSVIKTQSDDCGDYGPNPASYLIDEQLEYNLYMDNELEEALESLSGYIEFTSNRNAMLFYETKFKLNNDSYCFTSIVTNYGHNWSGQIVKYNNLVGIFIATISFLLIWGIYIITNVKKPVKRPGFVCLMILLKFAVTFLAGYASYYENDLHIFDQNIQLFRKKNCVEYDSINLAIQNLKGVYNATKYEYKLIIALFVFPWGSSIMYWVFKIFIRWKKNQKKIIEIINFILIFRIIKFIFNFYQ